MVLFDSIQFNSIHENAVVEGWLEGTDPVVFIPGGVADCCYHPMTQTKTFAILTYQPMLAAVVQQRTLHAGRNDSSMKKQ